MKKVMFICTGNICRSAMAEYLLKKVAQDRNEKIEVKSCGTYAENGDMSTYEAIEVMNEDYNIDLKAHRATNIMNSDIKDEEIILCATNNHKMFVIQLFPELKEKVYTIKEYVGEEGDISDPWGYGIMVYRKCASELYELANKIMDKLSKEK